MAVKWIEGGVSVEHDLILARSVTHAQRMQRVLEKAGLRCQIYRAPRELTDLGCAYALKLQRTDILAVLGILHRQQLYPVKIFSFRGGVYREVGF